MSQRHSFLKISSEYILKEDLVTISFIFPTFTAFIMCLGKEDFKPILVSKEIPIHLEGCGDDSANRLSSGSLEVMGFDMLTPQST